MKIQTTSRHPFYVEGEGWVIANQLQVGMNLQTMNGTAVITNLCKERTDEVISVYNFRVSGWSSYFVSEWNVYVHNGEGYGSLWDRIKNKFSNKTPESIGPDFVPYGKQVQEGVNPNSLIPTKDLTTLDNTRMQKAIKYGGNKPIIVDNLGNVLDDHHRLKYAIENNKAVDVCIGY